MAAQVDENSPELAGVEQSAIEKASEVTSGLDHTTEQLLNVKLDDKKTDSNGTTKDSKGFPTATEDLGRTATVNSLLSRCDFDTKKLASSDTANGADAAAIQISTNLPKQPFKMELGGEKTDSNGNSTTPAFIKVSTWDPKAKQMKVEFQDPEESDDDGKTTPSVVDSTEEKTKKKRKKSSGPKKPKEPRPTGFEEFYADPPITRQEHETEQEVLYASDRTFEQRMEVCIQRYRARRKLDTERSNILTKYMVLGGIDSGMKPFTGGLDNDLLENGTAEEIAAFVATDYIGTHNCKYYQPTKPEDWVIDFEGVVKGFLSWGIPTYFELTEERFITTCCNVIKNFLNYVLVHGVCPEYTQELMSSRILCDRGQKELTAIRFIRHAMPGIFQSACSVLYGSSPDKYIRTGFPIEIELTNGDKVEVMGMPQEKARRLFDMAMALVSSEKMLGGALSDDIHVVKKETCSFEVVELVRADEAVREAYAEAKDTEGLDDKLLPLGLMRVKRFENPALDDEDCSDDGIDVPVDYDTIEDFLMEDDLLAECFIGLKMHCTYHELSNGLKYFDEVDALYCSFLTVLPQQKMDGWKEPDLNPRGPPTVDNPYRDDDVGQGSGDEFDELDEKDGKDEESVADGT